MQKDPHPSNQLSVMLHDWYSWGIVCSSLLIHTHSLRIPTIVKQEALWATCLTRRLGASGQQGWE